MTKHLSLLAGWTVTAGALLSAAPVLAQQTSPPMASASRTVTPNANLTPDPMTTPTSVFTSSTAAPLSAPLVIPPPPGGKLRVEMDARSEDLLGMTKAFLKGIGETGQPVIVTPGRALSPPNPVADAIANGDLAAMLRDVNHVHMVVYEITPPAAPSPVTVVLPAKHGLKKPLVIAPVAPPAPAVSAFDSNSFYENAFAAEGAHRLLFTDADQYKLVMVGFPDRHGFAIAASGGGYVFVERSDGYPDLEVLTAFISHVTTAVVNSQMGKKMINSTVDPGKFDPGKLVHPEANLEKK